MYRFERSHRLKNGPRELTYVGLAFRQHIGKRIEQHQGDKLQRWKRHCELWISYAPLETDCRHIKARYEEVEHLLIYIGKPIEARKKLKSLPRGRLRIENTGWRGALPKEIVYPVALVK